MKKQTKKDRDRIVLHNLREKYKNISENNIKLHNKRHSHWIKSSGLAVADDGWKATKNWVESNAELLEYEIDEQARTLHLTLPKELDFHEHYDKTITNIHAIRKFARCRSRLKRPYKLGYVNLDKVKRISTSAALVLTAELSRWDDNISNITPKTEGWDPSIVKQLYDVGFFDLFSESDIDDEEMQNRGATEINHIKYIKGRSGYREPMQELKEKLTALGNKVNEDKISDIHEWLSKWKFLATGITEAITNVTHHAYPKRHGFSSVDKYWYLGGSYNIKTNRIKIVFYDRGIGIPKSLPKSAIKKSVVDYLAKLNIGITEKTKDDMLIKAAVEVNRTRTSKEGRGKGLQDLLEFIKKSNEGYMSILSGHGLYKYSSPAKSVKSEKFKYTASGTIIIWGITLNGDTGKKNGKN